MSASGGNLRVMVAGLLAVMGAADARAAPVTARDWGSVDGRPVRLFTLTGPTGIRATITNYGGRIVSLVVPDRRGRPTDVVLGYDDFEPYRHDGSYGAVIGRFVGRISHGGSFPLNGGTVQLAKARPDAKFVIHGGTSPFSQKLFDARPHDGTEPSVELTMTSPDGDGGFPGAVTLTVTYTLTRTGDLRIDYRATSDRPTWVNLTNHSYFALQGEGAGDIADQSMQVFADRYMPADADDLVTGEILPVAGTPMDMRRPVRLGDALAAADPQITMRRGLEISYVVNGAPGTLRPAARLSDPATGIVMDLRTTWPTMVAWSDNIGDRQVTGKGGKTYRNVYAMCLEAQGYLDAPNQPGFPQPMVTPARPLHEVSLFHFGTTADARPGRSDGSAGR